MANIPSPAHSPTEETEFFGGDIVIVDYISLINDGSKTSSKTSGIFPAGSKIERAFSITRAEQGAEPEVN